MFEPPPPPSPSPSSRQPESESPKIPASSSAARKRTGHACDRCRLMRVKCSGGVRCARCTSDGTTCIYGEHKRERNKRNLVEQAHRITELEDENRDLATALRRVTNEPDYRLTDDAQVMDLLAKYSRNPELGQPSPNRKLTSVPVAEPGGERSVPSSVGSPGHQGELSKVVDMSQGQGIAGFVGKASEMSWMQRCREHIAKLRYSHTSDVSRDEFDQPPTTSLALTYFVDDENLLGVNEDYVDPLGWPSLEVATIITEAFFRGTEGSFQFLSHQQFLQAMYSFPQGQTLSSWAERRWLALANMVWAVGSKWLQLAKLHGSEFPENHLTYYARARALGLDHRVTFDHPDMVTVQGIVLLAFYLLINGSISRAWHTICSAVQHGMALGLHLRVSDPSINDQERRTRTRSWFSMYNLQTLIAEITGRSAHVNRAYITAPLDVLEQSGVEDDPESSVSESNPASMTQGIWLSFLESKLGSTLAVDGEGPAVIDRMDYRSVPQRSFLYHVRMCQMSEEIADSLYAGEPDVPWSQTQEKIAELQRQLDAWTATLPDDLKITGSRMSTLYPQCQIHLAMYASSAAMMIHRPCLCKVQIRNESNHSKKFNAWSAQSCVDAALSMVDLMPDNLVPQVAYPVLPWWALLHYICQAAAVLLLELCLEVQHLPDDAARIWRAFVKAMSCLARMAEHSLSAYKAWRIFRGLLLEAAQHLGQLQLTDLEDAVSPQGWTAVEENELLRALAEE